MLLQVKRNVVDIDDCMLLSCRCQKSLHSTLEHKCGIHQTEQDPFLFVQIMVSKNSPVAVFVLVIHLTIA